MLLTDTQHRSIWPTVCTLNPELLLLGWQRTWSPSTLFWLVFKRKDASQEPYEYGPVSTVSTHSPVHVRSAYSEGAVLWYSEAVQTVSGEHARSVYRVMLVDSYSSADEHTVAVLQVRSEVEVAAAV